MKEAVEDVPHFQFLGMRFALATLALSLMWRASVRGGDRGRLRVAVIIGIPVGGVATQITARVGGARRDRTRRNRPQVRRPDKEI